MTNLWFAFRVFARERSTLIMSFVAQVHGTRRVEIPEAFRVHPGAIS